MRAKHAACSVSIASSCPPPVAHPAAGVSAVEALGAELDIEDTGFVAVKQGQVRAPFLLPWPMLFVVSSALCPYSTAAPLAYQS